jgi:hypothetical protein
MMSDLEMSNQNSETRFYREPSRGHIRFGSAESENDSAQRLLVRSDPKSDESFMGYIVRLTEENHYPTPSWIFRLAGIDSNQRQSCAIMFKHPTCLGKLAAITENDIRELSALTYPPAEIPTREDVVLFQDAEMYKYLIRPEQPKVCPDCLREAKYCRRIWDLLLVTACPIHHRLLLDRCPNCDAPLSRIRRRVSICTCEYDYRHAPVQAVDDDQLILTKQIYSLCGLTPDSCARNNGNEPIYDLNLSDLATLIVFMAGQYKGQLTISGRHYISKAHDISEVHKTLTKARRVFEKWPDRYYQFLEQRQGRDELEGGKTDRHYSGLGRSFGHFYEGLYAKLTSPNFNFMRESFSHYAATTWQGGYVSKARWHISSASKSMYVPRNEARRQLRASIEYIDRLVAVGELKAIVRQTGMKRLVLIDADSLARTKRLHEGALYVKGAAERLGISRYRTENLVFDGCLEVIGGSEDNSFKGWRFTETAIDNLLLKIRSKIVSSSVSDQLSTINFRMACQMLFGYKLRMSLLIKGIMSDAISPCGEDTTEIGLMRFLFISPKIDAYLKALTRHNRRGQ